MAEFILRAHSAPTDPERFLSQVGAGAHVEYLAQIVIAALFVSKGHRPDVSLTMVMEDSKDFSRSLTLSGDSLGNLDGLTEGAILGALAQSLSAARGLGKEQETTLGNGIHVSATSFERLVKPRFAERGVFLLDRKGEDIRRLPVDADSVFLLTDHVPMPRNLGKSLVRQGATPVSLGPVMLQASQCVSVVLNELDRRTAGI